MNLRKTKIICTLGPASDNEDMVRQLMLAGMNVTRLNFSHDDHKEQGRKLNLVKKVREELDLPVAILLDTKGPEVRTGVLEAGKVELKKGNTFTLTTKEISGDETIVSITYKELVNDVKPGNMILIDDGLIGLEVKEVTETDIICTVLNSGFISNRKGINVPGVSLCMPFVSQKDHDDIVFGVENGVDFIAASFTRSADDVLEIRKILKDHGNPHIKIIAKIENMQGVKNIDEILNVADGIMIARGDLGVEVPLEEVPIIQKQLIQTVYRTGKPVITATQMLDSMMKNPRPTRAETTDVANAIYQGTSAIMLSGETANGSYPLEALQTMVKIAVRTEADINYDKHFRQRTIMVNPDITNAVSHATCTTAADLKAAAIITVTKSGRTVGMISKFHSACPIIGCCMDEAVARQMNLYWGVQPLLLKEETEAEELFKKSVEAAEAAGFVTPGDITILTAGIPLGIAGTTNIMKVQLVGQILLKGKGLTKKKCCANVCVAKDAKALKEVYYPGSIIVVPETTNDMMEELKTAAAVITEQDGTDSHAAIVGLSRDIPVVIGAANATEILKNGSVVIVNAKDGVVTSNEVK